MRAISLLAAVVLTWSLFTGVVFAGDYSKLYGAIENMPENGYEGTWLIGGKAVNVYKKTIIKEKYGRVAIGRYVEVKGEWISEKFVAFSIEIEESGRSDIDTTHAKFYGTVEEMPQDRVVGTWLVSGRELLVTDETRIKEKYGTASVGSYIEVEGNFIGEIFTVYEIEIKDNDRHKSHKAYNSKIFGIIEDMPQDGYEGRWVVGGQQIEVSNKTVIDETAGKASQGSAVRVKGVRVEKAINASEIKITAIQ